MRHLIGHVQAPVRGQRTRHPEVADDELPLLRQQPCVSLLLFMGVRDNAFDQEKAMRRLHAKGKEQQMTGVAGGGGSRHIIKEEVLRLHVHIDHPALCKFRQPL